MQQPSHKVSVVIPCYYSEKMIGKVVKMTRDELSSAGYDYEFVLVNDGSTDGTFDQIALLCAEDPRVVGVNCAKNMGQHSAIMAGLRKTTGDLIMLMDDDMQTHPSQCLKLLRAIDEEGVDVVFASWEQHKEAWWRRLGSSFTIWSMRVLTNRPREIYASNFFVMREHIRDEIVRYTGPYVYIQGLLFRATANMSNVEVQHFAREEGQSGYTLKSLLRLWSTVLNFSLMPLRAASLVGAVMGGVGIIGALVVFIMGLTVPGMQVGWPSLMVTILTCSGIIIMFLGLIGEYLGRLFMTVNQSPQYVLKTVIDNRRKAGDPRTGAKGVDEGEWEANNA